MMKPVYRVSLFALAVAAMPAMAFAEDAFTLQSTDIYAGPSSEFPQIATLPPSTEVGVAGCLSDWSWCDVTFSNARGWVWAGDLGYPYESRRVAIIEFGPRLRLPVVTFSINAYWDAHYRSRPFYRERNVWVSRVHIEGGHGGTPPHGGTRVARPEGGAQPGATARAGEPQHAQPGQAMQRPREETAQRQGEQRSREAAAQKAQTDQRTRQEAQRAQPNQSQAHNAPSREEAAKSARPEEAAKSREARPQPEASRTQPEQRAQMNQRPQPSDQHAQAAQQGRNASQDRAGQREGREAQTAQSEATRAQPDRGANAKGPQNEASRGQPDRGSSAKGPQEERPKEERREGSQQ
jgi:uncharacterized protein YraI